MKRRSLLTAAAASAAFFLSSAGLRAAEPLVSLPGHIPPQLRTAALVDRVPSGERVDLNLVVRIDPSLMDRTLTQIYGPQAPKNRRFLSSAEFARKFDLADKRRKIKDFAAAAGLTLESEDRPSSLVVRVSGPSSLIEKAFGVELHRYRDPAGQVFRANDTEPSVPASLAPHLSAVLGLSNFRGARKPRFVAHHPASARPAAAGRAGSLNGGTGPTGLAPADIKSIYSIGPTLTGSSQTIALYELDGYVPSDVTLYEQTLFPSPFPNPSVACTSQDGTCGLCGANQDVACDGESPDDDGGMIEVALDIDMAIALAPSANILVYTGLNTDADGLADYAAIASDNIAKTISSSWGEDERDFGGAAMFSESTVFQQMAVQGQAQFAAAGDAGAYDASGITDSNGRLVSWAGQPITDDPASQPYVTGVGGTSLTGTVGGSITETVWNEGCSSTDDPGTNCANGGAGGGGVANFTSGATTYWLLPSYQSGVSTLYSTQDRNVPDVSLYADPNTEGYNICVGGTCDNCPVSGCTTDIGGTSAAAPLWASLLALANQRRAQLGQSVVGFANPSLYTVAKSTAYASVFNDITSGNNGFYDAGTGYDNASGWGSFKGDALINALSGAAEVFAASPEFTNVTSSAITVNWSTAGQLSGSLYTAQISSDGFSTVLASSATYGAAASFGLGGAGPSLTPATAYSFRVQTTSGSYTSPYYSLGQTYTLANAPGSLSVFQIWTSSITLQWSADGDPIGTVYEVSQSLDNFQTNFSTPIPFASGLTASTATITGLTSNATVYFRLRAENRNSIATAPSNIVSGQARNLPGPVSVSGAALGVSSIAWSWTLSSNATSYDLYNGVTGAFIENTDTPAFTSVGLSTNASFDLSVAGLNPFGDGLFSQTTAFTLAAPPAGLRILSVGYSSITLQWSANTDPGGTQYQAQSWTVGASTVTQTLSGLSATFTGLSASTSYYLAVAALNGNGVAAQSVTVETQTLPSPIAATVSGLVGAALGVSSVTWSWNALAGATYYEVYVATGSAAPYLATTSAALSYSLIGPGPNQPAVAYVAAGNISGAGPLTAGATAYSLAAPVLNAAANVGVTSMTVTWNPDGNPPETHYRLDYWTTGGSTATVTVSTDVAVLLGLTPAATYFINVQAVNDAGLVTVSFNPFAAVELPVGAAFANVTSTGTIIDFNPVQGPVVIDIPENAFPAPVNITVVVPSSYPIAPSASLLTGTGVGIQISLDEPFQPDVPVTLAISYSGTPFSQFNPERLIIARYDPSRNVWVPLASTPDPAHQLVTAQTSHLSLFQIMASQPAANLSGAKVFPNPMRVSRGETTMTFANLPAYASLKIYDILGEKVRELQTNAAGIASWDGKNSHGENAATSVYFVLATSGSSRTTLKVAIVR